ncbi:hypothetical protein Gotur_011233, partial [Gossypium turneri]
QGDSSRVEEVILLRFEELLALL